MAKNLRFKGVARLSARAAPFAVTLGLLLVASAELPPAEVERERMALVERSTRVVLAVAADGLGALGSARTELAPAGGAFTSTTLGLLGAWSQLSIGRVGLLDATTAGRLPWLCLAALLPWSVGEIVRLGRGQRTGLFAAGSIALLPGYLLSAASTHPVITVVSLWAVPLAVLALARGSGRRGRWCGAVGAGALVAIGAGLQLAALAGLFIVTLTLWFERPGAVARGWRRGQVPLPLAAGVGLSLTPIAVVALRPELWGADVIGAGRRLLDDGGLERASDWARVAEQAPGVRWLFAATWVLIALLAVIGAGALTARGLARRFASGRFRPSRDRAALGALVSAGALVSISASLVADGASAGLWLLPFAAIAAAIGLETSARWAAGIARAPRAGGVPDASD